MEEQSPVLTIEETARYLKLSTDTVYILARSKDFPAIKIGNNWRILRQELDDWLKKVYIKKEENSAQL